MRQKKFREYSVIFFAGLMWDAILSLDTISTAHYWWTVAGVISISTTLISYAMIDKILENSKVNWKKALTLALGSGIGSAVATALLGRIPQ